MTRTTPAGLRYTIVRPTPVSELMDAYCWFLENYR